MQDINHEQRIAAGLIHKINNLPPGKVLDVSNMRDNGMMLRTINQPTARSNKRGIPGVPIVSDNADRYIKAFEWIYGIDKRYEYMYYIAQAFPEAFPDFFQENV
jgi:hypothetical protein